MKKMNFYFNPMKCCTFILPILMMLFSITAQADNGGNKSPKATTHVAKSNAVAITISGFTSVGAAPASCASTTGTVTVNAVINTVPADGPYQYAVLVYNAANVLVASAPPVIVTTSGNTTVNAVFNLAPGTYTTRIVVVDPATSVTIVSADAPAAAVVGPVPADATAPTAGAACGTSVTLTAATFTPTRTLSASTLAVTTNLVAGNIFTDNCGITATTISYTGSPAALVAPFSGPVTFTATSAGLTRTCVINLTLVAPTPLVCAGGSPTAPASNYSISCGAFSPITAASVSNSTTGTVTIQSLGGNTIANTLAGLSPFIGKVVQVTVTVGTNSCWGYVLVEDKQAPSIVCPANVTLTCDQAGLLLTPGRTGQFVGSTNAVAQGALVAGGVNGSTDECSKYEQSFTDAGTIAPCVGGTIVRTWRLKDFWGNTSVTCSQTIVVSPAPAFAPTAFSLTTATLQCQDVTAAQEVILRAGGVIPGVILPTFSAAACGLSLNFVDARRLDICLGSYKIIRRYEVINMCGLPMVNGPYEQTIQVLDQTAPVATTTYQNFGTFGATYCFYMQGMLMTNQPIQQITALVPVTRTFFSTVIANVATTRPVLDTNGVVINNPIVLTPRADANMCNAAQVIFTVSAADLQCSNGRITWTSNDSRIRFNTPTATSATVAGGATVTVTGFIMRSQGTTFTIFGTDACGNVTSQSYDVNIVDNVSPQAVCVEEHKVSLNSNGTVRVNAQAFNNNRSTDNCGIERIHVRRMDKRNAVTSTPTPCDYTTVGASDNCASSDIRDFWNDYVDFDCGDAGRTDVMVQVRYVDAAGNFTDCMVNVTVEDKTKPICVSPADITSTCTSPDLLNFGSLFTMPAAYDNCGIARVDTSTTILTIGCTSTSVTRTWTFTDCNLNTTTCAQTLTVNPILGFRVTPIADSAVVCSGNIPTAEDDRQRVIGRLKLLHEGSAGSLTAITAVNGTTFTTCAAPVVDVTESVYSNTEFCKVLVRTFVIKDICAFSNFNSSITQQSGIYSTIGGDFQSVIDAQGRHLLRFTRIITIKDNTAPTSVPPTIAPICVVGTNCTFDFSTPLTGTDSCLGATTGSSLFFSWRVVNAANVTVASSTGTTVSVSGLPFGTYRIFYRVADFCGNLSTEYIVTVSGSDCKAPEILVHNKIVALGGQTGVPATGMAMLNYLDIANRITDNCDGDLTFSGKIVLEVVLASELPGANPTLPRNTTPNQTVRFTCADLPAGAASTTKLVRVWAIDLAGNWNYALSSITLQDNDNICGGTPRPVIAGAIGTETGSVVRDVVVSANANGVVAGSNTTVAAGTFEIKNLTAGTNYQVRAAKTLDNDRRNGVTTLDIALISKHLLALEQLGSAYKIIAADVDKNNDVNATDMLHIRRFILSITPSLAGGSAAWRFIDKSYAFRNATNPLGEDFPEVVTLSSVPAGTSAANFTAVKLGDVNNSFDATTVRGSRALVFNANDMDVVAGNEYTVAINAENFNASAFQGTFAFEGASVKAVKAGNLNNISDANFGMFNNAVTTSWNGKSEATAEVLNITFVATKSGKLSNMLTVNSSVTMAEGYDAAGNAMNVSLKFNTGKVAGGEFALYANTPNPFATSTTIGFNLPKDGQAKLTIYTAEGKVLSVINNTYKAGVNQVTVNKADLNVSGLVYYRLDTQDNSATKKMIIIE